MIDEQLRAPDNHNPLISVVLGFVSWTDALQHRLEQPISTMDEMDSVEQDNVMLALLGIFSVRHQLDSWVALNSPSMDSAETPLPVPEDLMR